MVKTKKQLVSSRDNTYNGINGRRYITIHETANYDKYAGAQTHANLQSNGFGSTWHWTVDDKQAIQSFPHTVRCWHAGDNRGNGNLNSIGIEICVNSDSSFKTAINNAAELVKKIMKEENIPIKNVVQHNHWSGKNCPTNLRNGSKGVNWSQFISLVNGSSGIASTSDLLRFGDKGSVVKKLQQDLLSISEKLPKYGADSDFGKETVLAVKSVQRKAGLAVDGVVGKDTRKAIDFRKNTPAPPKKEELTVAQAKKLQDQINQLKKELANKVTTPDKGNTPDDWAKKDWEEFKANGYTDGSRPKDYLKREEAAIIINKVRHNFLELIGK